MEYQQQFVFDASSLSLNTSSSNKSNKKRSSARRSGAGCFSAAGSATATLNISKPFVVRAPSYDSLSASTIFPGIAFSESGHLENFTESKKETTHKKETHVFETGAPVSKDVVNEKEKEKPEETPDSAPNSSLALVPISRFLKGIPQSPHFHQLRKYSEMVRDRLVAAWDRIFEETAEQIHDLKAEDFWDKSSELWKVMEELQSMGYNVISIRRRLVELTELMIELKQSKLEIISLKTKAENHRMEKCRLESIILYLQARIEKEEENKVQVLNEVDNMEKELANYDGLIASLAIKSFEVDD